jgi:hypothetical protein
MAIEIDFGRELGRLAFPDDITDEQAKSYVRENYQAIRQGLLDRRRQELAAETESEEAAKFRAGEVGTLETVGAQAGALPRAFTEGTGLMLQGAERAAKFFPPPTVNPFTGRPIEQTVEPEGPGALTKAGRAIREFGTEAFPSLPGVEETIPAQVMGGVGSTLSVLPGALVGGLAAGPVGTAATIGSALGAGALYGLQAGEAGAEDADRVINQRIAEALAAGDYDTASDLRSRAETLKNRAFLATAPIGAVTEGALGAASKIPGMRSGAAGRSTLGKYSANLVERLIPQTASKRVQEMARGGIEGTVSEGLQESLEQTLGNMAAKSIYDPERGIMDGVAEAGFIGAASGGLVGGVVGSRRDVNLANAVVAANGADPKNPLPLSNATVTGIEDTTPTEGYSLEPEITEEDVRKRQEALGLKMPPDVTLPAPAGGGVIEVTGKIPTTTPTPAPAPAPAPAPEPSPTPAAAQPTASAPAPVSPETGLTADEQDELDQLIAVEDSGMLSEDQAQTLESYRQRLAIKAMLAAETTTTPENAVQEQGSDEGVLRREGSQVGLQEMDRGGRPPEGGGTQVQGQAQGEAEGLTTEGPEMSRLEPALTTEEFADYDVLLEKEASGDISSGERRDLAKYRAKIAAAKAAPAPAPAVTPTVGVKKTSEFGADRENREYQIDVEGQRRGQANLARNEDGTWRVEMVSVDTPGKGIGPLAYEQIHSELEAEGSGLTSGIAGSLSESATRMWEKLVAIGKAEKTGQTYRMKPTSRATTKASTRTTFVTPAPAAGTPSPVIQAKLDPDNVVRDALQAAGNDPVKAAAMIVADLENITGRELRASYQEAVNRLQKMVQKPAPAPATKPVEQMTEQQYYLDRVEEIATANNISETEVRQYYTPENGREEYWQALQRAAEDGRQIIAKILDRLPEARIEFLRKQYPQALPQGYLAPGVRKTAGKEPTPSQINKVFQAIKAKAAAVGKGLYQIEKLTPAQSLVLRTRFGGFRENDQFVLQEKSQVTGIPFDRGFILRDKQEATAGEAPRPAPAAQGVSPADQIHSAKLPKELARSTPRYNFGSNVFLPTLGSDFDRAAYILAQEKPSEADQQFMDWAVDVSGMSPEKIRAHGKTVRAQLKELARTSTGGTQKKPAVIVLAPQPIAAAERPAPAPATAPTKPISKVPQTEPAGKQAEEVQQSPKQKQGTEPLAPRAQKQYLLEQLDEAIAAAPEDAAGADKIVITVPGDGEFTLLNYKAALMRFKDIAKKFPVGPVGGETKPRTEARQALKLGTLNTKNALKATGDLTADPAARPGSPLTAILSDGKRVVASNSKALLEVQADAGGTKAKPITVDSNGKQVEFKDAYPNIDNIIPSQTTPVSSKINTERLFTVLNQAYQAAFDPESKDAVNRANASIVLNRDGTIGLFAETPGKSSYSHNVRPGAKVLTSYNIKLLTDLVQAMRRVGVAEFDLRVTAERGEDLRLSPGVLTANGVKALIMPVRLDNYDLPAWALEGDERARAKPLEAAPLPTVSQGTPAQQAAGTVAAAEAQGRELGPEPTGKPQTLAEATAEVRDAIGQLIESITPKAGFTGGPSASDSLRRLLQEIPGAVLNSAMIIAQRVYRETRNWAQAVDAGMVEIMGRSRPSNVEDTRQGFRELLQGSSIPGSVPAVPPQPAAGQPRVDSRGYFRGQLNPETVANWNAEARRTMDSFGTDYERAFEWANSSDMGADAREWLLAELTSRVVIQTNSPNDIVRIQAQNLLRRIADARQKLGTQTAQAFNARTAAMDTHWWTHPILSFYNLVRDRQAQLPFPDQTSEQVRRWLQQSGRQAVEEVRLQMQNTNNAFGREFRRITRDVLRREDINWNDILTSSLQRQGSMQYRLLEEILSQPGLRNLPPRGISDIVNLFTTAWSREQERIFRNEFRRQVRLPTVRPDTYNRIFDAIPRILRYTNIAMRQDGEDTFLLWNEAFRNAVAPQFGVASFDGQTARRLIDLGQRAQSVEGVNRNEIIQQMYRLMAREGGINYRNLVRDYWYAAVLSGLRTQVDNALNVLNGLLNTAMLAARAGRRGGQVGVAAARGVQEGLRDFWPILWRGELYRSVNFNPDIPGNALEGIDESRNLFLRGISQLKYVSRLMQALDHVTAIMTDAGAKAYTLARTDPALLETYMIPSAQTVRNARQRAINEGTRPELVNKRTREIIEEALPPEVLLTARDIRQMSTFTEVPQGFAGALYHGINAAERAVPGIKFLSGTNFVRFASNYANELLNYFAPVALWRWYHSAPERRDAALGLQYTEARRDLLLAKLALGTALTGFAAALFLGDDDDEKKRAIDITGSFKSLSPEKKNQLLAEGRQPYSIRVGNTYISYRQMGFGGVLGAIGELRDQQLYSPEKYNKQSFPEKLLDGFVSGALIIKDSSAIAALTEFLGFANAYKYDVSQTIERATPKYLARLAGSVIPNIMKEADAWIDSSIYRAEPGNLGMEYFLQQVPFARQSIGPGPILNVLGEPVQVERYPYSRWLKFRKEDKAWNTLGQLASKGVFMPTPNITVTVKENGERRRMNRDEAYTYQKDVGQRYRTWIERNGDRLLKMKPDDAADVIDKAADRMRADAREKIQQKVRR